MISVPQLITLNEQRWAKCIILPSRLAQVEATAKRLVATSAKTQYDSISQATGVPWWVIAVIHEREADQNWAAHLLRAIPGTRSPGTFRKAEGLLGHSSTRQ